MKKPLTSIFVTTGVLLGLLIALQFQTDVPAGNTFVVDEVEARDSLFQEYLDEQSYLQSRIVALREEIEKAQTDIETQSEESTITLLEGLKEKVGLTQVTGKGLEITLNDSPVASREGADVSDINLVQASDIRDVVNLLNASDVDAISINGQRVIAGTPISAVGTTILVNNAYVSPPFVISAIGDTDIMLQRLLNEGLLPAIYERSAKGNIVFKIAVKEKMAIPIYNGNLKTDMLNLIE